MTANNNPASQPLAISTVQLQEGAHDALRLRITDFKFVEIDGAQFMAQERHCNTHGAGKAQTVTPAADEGHL